MNYNAPKNKLGLTLQLEEQRMIDDAKPLTEEEKAETRTLLTQGFVSWTKPAFTQFIDANMKFGRLDIAEIAKRVKGITVSSSYMFQGA